MPAMRQRLASADTLLSWSEPILKADSLDEVFRDFHWGTWGSSRHGSPAFSASTPDPG